MKMKYDLTALIVIVGLVAVLIAPLASLAQHAQAQGPGAGGQIVFQSNRDGNGEIYVMNADGSNPTNLTNNPARDESSAWAPNGTQITFNSNRDGNWEVYVMDADGSNPTNLTNNPAEDTLATWSPDSTQIAFTSYRDGNYEIYVMDTDGSNPTRLTNNPAYDGFPEWSPDGTQITFHSTRDGNYEIYAMDTDGSNLIRLTNNTANDADPVWSPDGTQIAFFSDRDGNAEIYTMDADGSNPIRITNHPAGEYGPFWSPDGTQLAFETERDGNREIYVMDADGSNPTNLTNNSADDYAPAWYAGSSGCYASAPEMAYQGDVFTLTLGCAGIGANVFGFQVGHEITAGAGLVIPQDSSYTAGDVFEGQPTLAGPNTLLVYALSLQVGGAEATGDFTLGSVDYSADAPGDATFDLNNLILGDINGQVIPDVAAAVTAVTVTIEDVILSLSGAVDPESFVLAGDLVFTLEGDPAYDNLVTTFNPVTNAIDFTFTNIHGQPAWLQVDGPAHVTCEQPLTFPLDAGDEVLPDTLVLLAGDVTGDDAVDIVDASAIGMGYGLPPTGELDINGDGAVNILDLIHVGRNYGTTGPTPCS